MDRTISKSWWCRKSMEGMVRAFVEENGVLHDVGDGPCTEVVGLFREHQLCGTGGRKEGQITLRGSIQDQSI